MEKLNELVDLVKRARHSEYTADVVAAENEIIAQDWYENILAIAEAFRALEQENSELRQQRAGLAKEANDFEAKLAELQKQEPVAYSWRSFKKAQLTRTMPESWKQPRDIKPLFTRPAPATDLAELVPDSVGIHDIDPDSKDIEVVTAIAQCEGWNACRAAILRKIEETK